MSPATDKNMEVAKPDTFNTGVYAEESSQSKFQRKFKESPFMVIGILGCIGVVAYGVNAFKNRSLKPSIFIMQLRVAAQGAVVGMLTLGCGYQLYRRLNHIEIPEEEERKQ